MPRSLIYSAVLFIVLLPFWSSCKTGAVSEKALALEKKSYADFFIAAADEVKAGHKKDAAFLFYLGQLRGRYYVQSNPATTPADKETYTAAQLTLGQYINDYLGGESDTWVNVLNEVIAWDKTHEYEYYPKTKDPKTYQDILGGLIALRDKVERLRKGNKQIRNFDYLPGFDFKLFNNTAAADLATAVENENIAEIESILKSKKTTVDFAEPKFGHTLLMLAAANNRKQAAEKLLQMGADPNKLDNEGNLNALYIACSTYAEGCETDILQLLIANHGNVNKPCRKKISGKSGKDRFSEKTPLMLAAEGDCLEKVKTLVNAGADINASTGFDGHGAITSALVQDKLQTVRYLIIEKHTQIPKYCYIRDFDPEKIERLTVSDMLNEQDYTGDPELEKLKQEILTYLRSKGLK